MNAGVSPFTGRALPLKIAVLRPNRETFMTTTEIIDWLAWAANARRIDNA